MSDIHSSTQLNCKNKKENTFCNTDKKDLVRWKTKIPLLNSPKFSVSSGLPTSTFQQYEQRESVRLDWMGYYTALLSDVDSWDRLPKSTSNRTDMWLVMILLSWWNLIRCQGSPSPSGAVDKCIISHHSATASEITSQRLLPNPLSFF